MVETMRHIPVRWWAAIVAILALVAFAVAAAVMGGADPHAVHESLAIGRLVHLHT